MKASPLRVLVKKIAAMVLSSCLLPLCVNGQATAEPQKSHWYYCSGTEVKSSKNTYYSTTFSSPTEAGTLFRNFSNYVSQHYDVPTNGLTGVCYGARPYLSDTFASVEYQRSQDMTQANKHRQNVIPTGWAGK
jgi:hypothetical protein